MLVEEQHLLGDYQGTRREKALGCSNNSKIQTLRQRWSAWKLGPTA